MQSYSINDTLDERTSSSRVAVAHPVEQGLLIILENGRTFVLAPGVGNGFREVAPVPGTRAFQIARDAQDDKPF